MDNTPIEVYANAVAVSTSIYDVTLQFATQLPAIRGEQDEPSLVEVSNACNVHMSAQHAKSLVALLAVQILEYERRFGTRLPLPEDLHKFWTQIIKEDGTP